MTDFHSHLLPAMDDGSPDTETSLRMLEAEEAQGVTRVVLTPHFYPARETPADFLKRRAASYARLRAAYGGTLELVPGAEIFFYDGISRSKSLSDLRIGDTDAILIEMPFCEWTEGQLGEIFNIEDAGFVPVIAHVERYLCRHNKKMLERLLDGRILIQSNAEFFIDRNTRRTAVRMLKKGMIHLIGSDCHNLTSRAPDIGEGLEYVGADAAMEIRAFADSLFLPRR